MSRLRWPDSTNSVSEKPGTIHHERRPLGVDGQRLARAPHRSTGVGL